MASMVLTEDHLNRYTRAVVSRKEELQYVVANNLSLFETIASVTNTNVEYLKCVERTIIESSSEKYHHEIKSYFMKEGKIDGPHAISFLELQGGGELDASYVLLTATIGEVHQNPQGCTQGALTVFNMISNLLMTSQNLYLILESFFHLWIKTASMARRVSQALQSREQNEHSMWQACKCISDTSAVCTVNNKKVGQLILFRAFAFIFQVTVAFLNEANIKNSAFHQLEKRIRFMDLREDLDLRPYEWLDGKNEKEKLQFARELLVKAKPNIPQFIPEIRYDDLKSWYDSKVETPLMDAVNKFISTDAPTKDMYDYIFTSITELVTIAHHLNILENQNHCHTLIVAGDKHRELVVQFLKQVFGNKVLNEATYNSGERTSCVSTNQASN